MISLAGHSLGKEYKESLCILICTRLYIRSFPPNPPITIMLSSKGDLPLGVTVHIDPLSNASWFVPLIFHQARAENKDDIFVLHCYRLCFYRFHPNVPRGLEAPLLVHQQALLLATVSVLKRTSCAPVSTTGYSSRRRRRRRPCSCLFAGRMSFSTVARRVVPCVNCCTHTVPGNLQIHVQPGVPRVRTRAWWWRRER